MWYSPSKFGTKVKILIIFTLKTCFHRIGKNGTQFYPSEEDWQLCEPSSVYTYEANKLTPGREYVVSLLLQYQSSDNLKIVPSSNWTVYERDVVVTTVQDAALTPGKPFLSEDGSLEWLAKEQEVEVYQVQAIPADSLNSMANWTDVGETSDTYWPVGFLSEYEDLLNVTRFVFRVRAKNQFGWSGYSHFSNVIDVSQVHIRTSASRQPMSGTWSTLKYFCCD